MSPARPAAVVVLAAGEGTRMKSAIPKVLHADRRTEPGRPRGHGGRSARPRPSRRRRRPRPRRRSSPTSARSPPRSVPRCRTSSTAPGTPCSARSPSCPSLTGTVVVTYGDVPLLTADTLRALVAAPRRAGNAVTVLTAAARRPHRLRPDRPRSRRPVRRRSSSTRTPREPSARSARSTPASTRSTPPPCATRWRG